MRSVAAPSLRATSSSRHREDLHDENDDDDVLLLLLSRRRTKPKQKKTFKKRNELCNRVLRSDWWRLSIFFSLPQFFFSSSSSFFFGVSLCLFRARERERESLCSSSSVNREKQTQKFLFFFPRNVFSICAPKNTSTHLLLKEIRKRDTSIYTRAHTLSSVRAIRDDARDVRAEIICFRPPFILRRFVALISLLRRAFRGFRATTRKKREYFFNIASTRVVAKSALFQPVVLFDLEKTEGENTPVRGASVREESETIFVLSGVLLRVVVQKSSLGNVDSSASASVSRLRDCVSTRVLRLV